MQRGTGKEPLVSSQPGSGDPWREVVTLGAVCEITAGDEPDHGRQLSFSVAEFADLSDGTRIMVHTERGFSSSINRGDPWLYATAVSIRRDVLTTVLPDDDEDPEDHPWGWLAELIGRHGIAVDAESLKRVPYVVEFGQRLLRQLDAVGPSPEEPTNDSK
jgi:hypothetical protein